MNVERETSSGYLQCPLCDAEVPVSEDNRAGDRFYCSYCQCPLMLREKDDTKYLGEDF